MSKSILPMIALGSVLALSACARNKESLPPPPPQAAPALPPEVDQPATVPPPERVVTDSAPGAGPGSQADMVAQAGSDRVLFALDSYALDEAARQILGAQASWLGQYPAIRVTVEGHTDERGTREYNLALGERRASAAKNFLAAQGVDSSRISIISYGKERPEMDGSNEEAWAANRRAVTITIAGAR